MKDIDAYVAGLAPDLQPIARAVRKTIRDAAPAANEAIKYGMPTFLIGKTAIVYFAVWKKHVGLYPIYTGEAAFEARVDPYRAKKDTVQFPLTEPIPYDLVSEIVASQLARLAA